MSAIEENRIWKKQVQTAAARDNLGHAIILCGDGDLMDAADYISAAYLCEGSSRPCLRCNSCRKVTQHIHPDVTIVQDSEHRYISVDVIRKIRSEAYIQPNEGARRVFLFPDCTLLTEQDQNVLLKILEDGPPYAAFLFCAKAAHNLLPTIRSRCIALRVAAETVSAEDDPQAQELCHCIAQRKMPELARVLVAWELKKPKREQLLSSLQCAHDLVAQALLSQYGKAAHLTETSRAISLSLEPKKLEKLLAIFEKACHDCEYNVGVGLTLGAMLSDIEEVIS